MFLLLRHSSSTMAAKGDIIIRYYTFTGKDCEVVPPDATHVTVDESVTVIPRRAFYRHQNIVEVDCRNAKTVEADAFRDCPSLRRVKMPGVIIVERHAFYDCYALTDVECDKLERIGGGAFFGCNSLRSINLPSVKIVEGYAFYGCDALMEVKFGDKLETIVKGAFISCTSLERIAIPLKDGIVIYSKGVKI
jgi:hypothetical protein